MRWQEENPERYAELVQNKINRYMSSPDWQKKNREYGKQQRERGDIKEDGEEIIKKNSRSIIINTCISSMTFHL